MVIPASRPASIAQLVDGHSSTSPRGCARSVRALREYHT